MVLTYTSYKEHCDLYTEIHGSIAVNSCQIELAQKYIILLSSVSIIVYKVGKCTGVENTKFISFNLSAGTYSIDDLMQKLRWQSYRKDRTGNHLKLKTWGWWCQKTTHSLPRILFLSRLTTLIRSILPPSSYKSSLDTSPPPKSLSLHCKQINKLKNELDDQSSSLLNRMHVSNYKATLSLIHLVFLELDTHRPHLDFKILDENNNEVIPRTFYLQLLNKQWAYTTMKLRFIQI